MKQKLTSFGDATGGRISIFGPRYNANIYRHLLHCSVVQGTVKVLVYMSNVRKLNQTETYYGSRNTWRTLIMTSLKGR